jgi:hypothetical protein
MPVLSMPGVITVPWATGGGANQGYVNLIPTTSDAPMASMADGFALQTMLSLQNGGVPPLGADMNGILQLITQHLAWINAGNPYPWSSLVVSTFGGYNLGAVVLLTSGVLVQSTVANNSVNPNISMVGWQNVVGGGGSGCTRTTLNFTSGSLAPAVDEIDTVPTGADSFLFFNMAVSGPCRVRVYATAAFAAADRTRPSSQDPVGNMGMYLEMVFIPGVLTWTMAPIPVAVNQDIAENQNIYMTIQNLGSSTTTVTVNASLLKME